MKSNKHIEKFSEAYEKWDLEKLFSDLSRIRVEQLEKQLTEREKLIITGLLCGYSPQEIGDKLSVSPSSIKVSLMRSIYPLISNLVGRKIKNYSQVIAFLYLFSDYQKTNKSIDSSPITNMVIEISGDVDKEKLEKITNFIKKFSQDNSLMITEIKEG